MSETKEFMNGRRAALVHLLAALAYRTQKALRGAPTAFGDFNAGHQIRTPSELIRHMTAVLNYARSLFEDGRRPVEPLASLDAEILRFHETLDAVARHLKSGNELRGATEEQLLQGPFADAMTHAGQLALLRRVAGVPVTPENFMEARVDAGNLGPNQPAGSLLEP